MSIAAVIIFSCGSIMHWKAENFERHDCALPDKLQIEASMDDQIIQISIMNTTKELWQFDINSSSVIFLTSPYPWSSALIDNHAGNPNAPKSALLPGKTSFTLYPMSLIQESDDDFYDVHWRPWPMIKDQIAELKLAFIDPEGIKKICTLSGEFKASSK